MLMSMLKSDTLGIGQLINQFGLLEVPKHQRDYAWKSDNIEEFLDDIIAAYEENQPDYFLGLIVLISADNQGVWRILDGQQRLATTTMIYAAIRQWMSAAGKDRDDIQIQHDYIGVRELGEEFDRPRLTLNLNNRQTFLDLVITKCTNDVLNSRRDATGRFSSDRKLIEATIACRKRVFQLAQSAGTDPELQAKKLYGLANYLRTNARVVYLEVPSHANAYVIFESLNDRGNDLSVLDLLKNYIFGEAGTRFNEAEANWLRMTAQLGDREADDFLKVFWTSRFGRIQKGKLFKELRSKYRTEIEVMRLSSELAEAAEQYAALGIPDHDIWSDYGTRVRERLRILNDLGNKQNYAILLSALKQFKKPDDMEKLLRYLTTLTIRYQLVGKGRTGALEISSAKVAGEIYSGDLDTPMKVWRQLMRLVPNDQDFHMDFMQFQETKATRAKLLLGELEVTAFEQAHRGKLPQLSPIASLTLEHVFPKSPGGAWSQEMRDCPDWQTDYVNRLGNLCLVDKLGNKEAGNRSFGDKAITLYAPSPLELTSQIARDYSSWGCKEILQRQEYLADLAVLTWPLPHTN